MAHPERDAVRLSDSLPDGGQCPDLRRLRAAWHEEDSSVSFDLQFYMNVFQPAAFDCLGKVSKVGPGKQEQKCHFLNYSMISRCHLLESHAICRIFYVFLGTVKVSNLDTGNLAKKSD